jgi:hypothetical protein
MCCVIREIVTQLGTVSIFWISFSVFLQNFDLCEILWTCLLYSQR